MLHDIHGVAGVWEHASPFGSSAKTFLRTWAPGSALHNIRSNAEANELERDSPGLVEAVAETIPVELQLLGMERAPSKT